MGGRLLLSPETLPDPRAWAGPCQHWGITPRTLCYLAKGKSQSEQEFTLLKRLGEVRAARETAEYF